MVNYCHKCGKKVNPIDKFCKECGTVLTEPLKEIMKKEPITEKSLVPKGKRQVNFSNPLEAIFIGIPLLFVVLMILWLAGYSVLCATGAYPDTVDEICQSLSQSFSGSSDSSYSSSVSDSKTLREQSGCPVGTCVSNGHCCPTSARYYCNGKCYSSKSDAVAVDYRCSNFKIYC
ncbi:MAG: zinc-ribbon domain-containing protein [DPANN group archaeon]|nr:zinc-ribbon domain-containing protein [DPANN group archaeon]